MCFMHQQSRELHEEFKEELELDKLFELCKEVTGMKFEHEEGDKYTSFIEQISETAGGWFGYGPDDFESKKREVAEQFVENSLVSLAMIKIRKEKGLSHESVDRERAVREALWAFVQ